MNPDIKERWVAALRSGKYQQIAGMLRKQGAVPRYCCLGVLCELAMEDDVVSIAATGDYVSVDNPLDRSITVLPAAVANWAGLDTLEGVIDMDVDFPASLATLNDTGTSFNDIAALIDKYL